MQIWIPTNPRGAERLAPGIIESQSDLYPRRLWGSPDKVSKIIINSSSSSSLSNFTNLPLYIFYNGGLLCICRTYPSDQSIL